MDNNKYYKSILDFVDNIDDNDIKNLVDNIMQLMVKGKLISDYETYDANIITTNELKNEFNNILENCYKDYAHILKQSAPKM